MALSAEMKRMTGVRKANKFPKATGTITNPPASTVTKPLGTHASFTTAATRMVAPTSMSRKTRRPEDWG